jgi:hypothetical protein
LRTCTLCKATSADTTDTCSRCGADLSQLSATAVALARLRENPRVGIIRLIVAHEACPACKAMEGEYEKKNVPELPVAGCSHENGCRCFYAPSLIEIFP